MGKFGQTPVGLFSGTPNVSVPIYNYKAGKINVPISLSYSSNGIKVDQISTNVGLGWNLNVGGVITRIVRDRPDSDKGILYPEKDIHEAGYQSPMALEFFYLAGQQQIDTEKDLYSYNFMGYTGSFVKGYNHEIIMMPYKDLRIDYYSNDGGFKIITPDGTSYFFLEAEKSMFRSSGGGIRPEPIAYITAWYLSKIEHISGDVVEFIYENDNYSYTLSKSESITVPTPTYQNGCSNSTGTGPGYTVNPVISSNLTVQGRRLIKLKSNHPENGYIDLKHNKGHPGVGGLDLVSDIVIKSKEDKVIEAYGFQYKFTANNRVFLEQITERDVNRSFSFSYHDPEGLAMRLSAAQDHWGFYNGKKSNKNYFPNLFNNPSIRTEISSLNIGADKSVDFTYAVKGLLKKITYPTKGFTTFEYEPNTYNGKKTIAPEAELLQLTINTGKSDVGGRGEFDKVGTIPTAPFDYEASMVAFGGFNAYDCDQLQDVGKSKAHITVVDDQTGENLEIIRKTQSGSISSGGSLTVSDETTNRQFYLKIKKGHSYTVRIQPTFTCVSANLMIYYHTALPEEVYENIIVGGVRIKRSKDFQNGYSDPVEKRYYYGKKETPLVSSGVEGIPSYYLSEQTNQTKCQDMVSIVETYYTTLNSSSVRPLFNSFGNSTTYYEYVTISHGGDDFENGGEEKEFLMSSDAQGNPIVGDYIASSPWNNTGWDNGQLHYQRAFKVTESSDIVVLREIENKYKKDERISETTYGYSINKKYDFVGPTGSVTYQCKAEDINKTYKYSTCITDHGHSWFAIPWKRDWVCLARKHNNVELIFYHPCRNKSVGEVLTYPNEIDNLDITEYSLNSYWHYLDETIERTFNSNGEDTIEVVNKYYYDNPVHLQPSRTEVTTSKGNKVTTKTYYPDDITSESFLNGGNLSSQEYTSIGKLKHVEQHRIATPIQVEIWRNGEKISSQRTTYQETDNGTVLPSIVKAAKGNAPLEPRLRYHAYDSYGNPTAVSKEDGTVTSYIWGYNGQYPVAKIVNAKNDEGGMEVSGESWVNANTTQDPAKGYTKGKAFFYITISSAQTANLEITSLYSAKGNGTGEVSLQLVSSDGKNVYAEKSFYEAAGLPATWSLSLDPGVYHINFTKPADVGFTMKLRYSETAIDISRVGQSLYEGFEEYSGGEASSNARTGKFVYNGKYTLELRDKIPGKYILSYWRSNDGETWNRLEDTVTIEASSAGRVIGETDFYIDDVRLHPIDAQMITYTYDPLVGMTSETDPNGITIYYEYDDFNRLKSIKDHEGNVLETYNYHYAEKDQ
ncbi:hypothetical protein DN752_01420 [Echinicola strongylocentroti]|uniref:Sugar-binding protein n=1 Tax=Echinicola strongylocentroti TaxID=1795355 RepID=A0A2Z4IE35_9BACT|nr:hypothetical protein [Echinicola strongylocentroti]AWW28896.1 hypothetical protein DN752_01420 [Echinicola strongylocentroti]